MLIETDWSKKTSIVRFQHYQGDTWMSVLLLLWHVIEARHFHKWPQHFIIIYGWTGLFLPIITQYQYSVIWYIIYKIKYPSRRSSCEQTSQPSTQPKGAIVGKLLMLLRRLRCWLTRWFHWEPYSSTDFGLSRWTIRWIMYLCCFLKIIARLSFVKKPPLDATL